MTNLKVAKAGRFAGVGFARAPRNPVLKQFN